MADDNKSNDKDKNANKGGEFRVPPRTWIVWVAIIGSIVTLVMLKGKIEYQGDELYPQQFLQLVDSNLIASVSLNFSPQSHPVAVVEGTYFKTDEKGEKIKPPVPFRTKTLLTEETQNKLVHLPSFAIHEPNQLLLNMIWGVLPFVLIGAFIWFFFIRQIKMAGKGALSFGKSKARLLAKERNKTTFKDVAGVDEAIEEVSELVEFLKDPKKFQRLGGRIPKGVLMIGAAGTGKTLLAKAIAGEADAAFFSISGSDFVEMFVGVGASRVRDMFEQARKSTPCLI